MSEFNIILDEKIRFVEDKIYEYLPKEESRQKIITEAMNYSVKAGGKRIRPILMYETAKLFLEPTKDIYPFMAAIEFIHTYSLVHDDLPAMDNDEFRRGRKTTHAQFGEDIGVLTGDALLNYAFEIMSETILNSENQENCVKAMNIISKKAGIYGMIGGQTVDVINEGKQTDIDTILYIHNLKTAALIEASMMAGACLSGASDADIDKIEKVAKNIGIAFQIQDDILDVTGTIEVLGKPVLSDEKNNKVTYVTIKGIEESKKQVVSYSKEAEELIKSLGGDCDFLIRFIEKLIYRKK
jgi:geranylgeranyl diphosphate synthase type II